MASDLRFTIEVDGIQKTITSISEANKVIRDLTKNFVLTKEAGKDLTATLGQLNKALEVKNNLVMVSKGAVELNKNMAGAQTASANASMALLNLNYVIRDSPYFFNNFALGVLAVGNNLNPLIDSFNRLRQEAVGKSISTMALLKQALVGGAGISIAFSLVVTAIQSFVFWQSKASRESENHTQKLKEEADEVSRLRGEYNSLVRERELRGQEDTSFERYAMLRGTATQMRQTLREKRRELGLYRRDSINYKETSEFIKTEEANLKIIENELNYIVYAWQNVIKENEKDNKKLKEKKAIVEDLSAQEAKLINIRQGSQMRFGEGIFKRQDIRNIRGDKPEGLSRPSVRTGASGFGGEVKDLGVSLEMAKIASQELGNALASAFEQGTIKLNELLQSIGVAIAKMLIMKAVMSFFTGGLGGAIAVGATPSLPSVGNPSLGSATNNMIRVQGRITANKNQFIADIENARDYFNNNEKLVLIGRS